MTVTLCKCGHTKAAHNLTGGVCEYARARKPYGCGCSEFDPAEPCDVLEAVEAVWNREEMARVYASLLAGGVGEIAWPAFVAVNGAILERWSLSGLAYVKGLAWRLVEKGP